MEQEQDPQEAIPLPTDAIGAVATNIAAEDAPAAAASVEEGAPAAKSATAMQEAPTQDSKQLIEMSSIWETQQYFPFRGFGKPVGSASFIDAHGAKLRAPVVSGKLPVPPLPRGWRWAPGSSFKVDLSWGPVDDEGWTYATTVSGFREQMLTGNACGAKHAGHFFRRRRWVRPRICASKRVRRETHRHLRALAADKARAEWLLREKEGWFQSARAFEHERRTQARAVRRDVRMDAMATDHRAEGGVRFLRQMGAFVKEKGAVQAEFAAAMSRFVASQRAAEARAGVASAPAAAAAAAAAVTPPSPANGSGENTQQEQQQQQPVAAPPLADHRATDASGDSQEFQALPPSSEHDGSGGEAKAAGKGGGMMEAIETAVMGAVSPLQQSRPASASGGAAADGSSSAFPPHESFFGSWSSAALSMYESMGMLAGSFAHMTANELFRDVAALHSEYAAVRHAMTNEVSALWSSSKAAEDAVHVSWQRVETAFSDCCTAAAAGIQRLTDALHAGDASHPTTSVAAAAAAAANPAAPAASDGERTDVWVEEQRYRAALLASKQQAERLGKRVSALVAATATLEARRVGLTQRVRRMLLLEESRVASDVSSLVSTYCAELASQNSSGSGEEAPVAAAAAAATAAAGGEEASTAAAEEGVSDAKGKDAAEADASEAGAAAVGAAAAAATSYQLWSAEPPPASILAATAGLLEMHGSDGSWRPVAAVVTRDQFLHLFEAPQAAANAAAAAPAAVSVAAALSTPETEEEAAAAVGDGGGEASSSTAAAAGSKEGSPPAASADVSSWLGAQPALSMDVGAAQATIGGGEGVYEIQGVVGKAAASAFGKRVPISARVVLRTAASSAGAAPIDLWIASIRTPSAGMEGAAAAAEAATAAAAALLGTEAEDDDGGADEADGASFFEEDQEGEEGGEEGEIGGEGVIVDGGSGDFFDEDDATGSGELEDVSVAAAAAEEGQAAEAAEEEVGATAVDASAAAAEADGAVDDEDDEVTLEL